MREELLGPITQKSAISKLSLSQHILIHIKRSDCQQAEALDLISIIRDNELTCVLMANTRI